MRCQIESLNLNEVFDRKYRLENIDCIAVHIRFNQ